jgi:excisionase family DNA binding protein
MNELPVHNQRLLLTAREAAKMLSISERSLWSLTKSGQIAVVKIGSSKRYSIHDIERFIANQTQYETTARSTQAKDDA